MSIFFVCILVLSATCQNCFIDAADCVDDKQLVQLDVVGDLLGDLVCGLLRLVDNLVTSEINLLKYVLQLLEYLLKTITNGEQGLEDIVNNLLDSVNELLKNVVEKLLQSLKSDVNSLLPSSEISNTTVIQMTEVCEEIDTTLGQIEVVLKKSLISNSTLTNLTLVQGTMKIIEVQVEGINEGKIQSDVGDLLGGLVGGTLHLVDTLLMSEKNLLSYVFQLLQSLFNAISSVGKSLEGIVDYLLDSINGLLKSVAEQILLDLNSDLNSLISSSEIGNTTISQMIEICEEIDSTSEQIEVVLKKDMFSNSTLTFLISFQSTMKIIEVKVEDINEGKIQSGNGSFVLNL